MNDKKIKEQLQQENIIVPESLHPEQMRKKLEQHKEANTTSSSLHPTHVSLKDIIVTAQADVCASFRHHGSPPS